MKQKGVNTKTTKQTSSDADGYFEFTDLEVDTYIITAKKKGFKPVNQRIKLEDGEVTDIEIEMKRTMGGVKGWVPLRFNPTHS